MQVWNALNYAQQCLFAIGAWTLRNVHNSLWFRDVNTEVAEIICLVKNYEENIQQALDQPHMRSSSLAPILQWMSYSEIGGYKLNVDGVLDMYNGRPILIYVLAMELYTMKMGIVYTMDVGWLLLTLESDSSNIVHTVMGEDVILQRRKRLRMLFVVSFVLTNWLITLFHIKQNVVAHRVAHYSLNHQGVSFSDDVGPYG